MVESKEESRCRTEGLSLDFQPSTLNLFYHGSGKSRLKANTRSRMAWSFARFV
jgi:hypothetical protein